jgi:hypothetical protein
MNMLTYFFEAYCISKILKVGFQKIENPNNSMGASNLKGLNILSSSMSQGGI